MSGVGEARGVGNGSGSCALTAGTETNRAMNRDDRIANCRLPIADCEEARAIPDRFALKIGNWQLAIGSFVTASSSRPHPTESGAEETAALISLCLSRADWFLHQPRLETSHRMRVLPDIVQDNRGMWQ